MRRLLTVAVLAYVLAVAGCAFKRSDFVCGPDGKPEGELSDSAKVVGAVAGGPRLAVKY
jgi:hypothetical protein